MAERSGSTGILGVIIGAVLVIALVFFLFGGFNDADDVDVSLENPAVETPADDDTVTGTVNINPTEPAQEEAEEPVAPAEPAEPITPAPAQPQ